MTRNTAQDRFTVDASPTTVEQPLDRLLVRSSIERRDLIEGEPVQAMPAETMRHVQLRQIVPRALMDGIRAAGARCCALGDGPGVRADHLSSFQPDAIVAPPNPLDLNRVQASKPVIPTKVEFVSTRQHDQVFKSKHYVRGVVDPALFGCRSTKIADRSSEEQSCW